MDRQRTSGILLHLTSLPTPFGIGDLGPAAYEFADFLVQSGQQIWQVLPLVPLGYGYSPYAGLSTFAGNVLLISPERMLDDGLLDPEDLTNPPDFPAHTIDYAAVEPFKYGLLTKAFERFKAGTSTIDPEAFAHYCQHHADWLDDFALFMTLKDAHDGKPWTEWDPALARREPAALQAARETHARSIEMHKFWQYLFDTQWYALHDHCRTQGIRIFGDLPIYVAHDSADVWANPHLFFLDDTGRQTVVAGVPPDYFSETGQRWGNPIYRWDQMRRNGYAWWVRRFARILKQVDLVRLDHFRGFEAYWEVPATEPTAIHGRWVQGPGADLFQALEQKLGKLPVIAENLGVITDGVTRLMERFSFPGMAILEFAFDSGASNDFLPHNYVRDLVAYTGTHDNDTVMGWWVDNASTQDAETVAKVHHYCREYLNLSAHDETELHWHFVRAVMGSVADTVVVPLQDLLGLGSEARMNTPGTTGGNWAWRFNPGILTVPLAQRLHTLTETYGRL